jgi:UDP-N-acetylglucosamine 2-epimerase (non-hydrolysing)
LRKILLVFGTRPEAIKMAPLIHELRKHPKEFNLLVCATGQHRQMLDQVLEFFEIKPDVDLDVMTPGQDLATLTSSILTRMCSIISEYSPDLILIHGDTTTAFATALAGFYSEIQVGHVEAGLRTFNLRSPFPEEFNRQAVTRLASLHFAPTETARANLLAEGVSNSSIAVTGNTVIDALKWTIERIQKDQNLQMSIVQHFSELMGFSPQNRKFILVTGHRRENFGQGFLEICESLRLLSQQYPHVDFVYPVHLNPQVLEPVSRIIGDISNVHIIPPQDYMHFVYLMSQCYLVLTDSGGIQEEAPSIGKPVLLMRETTERPEAVAAGAVRLVGANSERIVSKVTELLESEIEYEKMSKTTSPYGNGNSSS